MYSSTNISTENYTYLLSVTHSHPLLSPFTHLHSPLTVSTPLSTTALTLALNALFAHSTSRSSNHTLATHLSNLICTPGTGMPKLCSLLSSWRSSADTLSSLSSLSTGVSSLVGGGEVDVELRGRVMGDTESAPNCASRKRKRRARRVEGSVVWCGWDCLKRWESCASVFSLGA